MRRVQYFISTHIVMFRTSQLDRITIQKASKLGQAVCQGNVILCCTFFLNNSGSQPAWCFSQDTGVAYQISYIYDIYFMMHNITKL